MNSLTADRLYSLLPAVYRLRDAEQGEPLRALVGLLAQEFAALEENLDQLYDDQFIETCADWVAPYIGDLIGYRPLHGVAAATASPRAEVAHTIAYRRRKGTASMLEQLARDVTGWPAHAAEFFEQLVTTQYMKHVRLPTGDALGFGPRATAVADLRDLRALDQRDGGFNTLMHTAEMRRPEAGSGRYNIPNIGLFLWRLLALPLTQVPLTPDAGDASGRKYRVNPLGADLALFRRAQTEGDIGHLSEPVNVPAPLSVRAMARAVRAAQASTVPAPDAVRDDDYGPGESVVLWRAAATAGDAPVAVPVAQIRICDLRDRLDSGGNPIGWNHEDGLPAGTVGLDPERGRVLLADAPAAGDAPWLATFHYGSVRALGGGEYARVLGGTNLPGAPLQAAGGAPLQPLLDSLTGGGRLVINDSLTYAQTPTFRVDDVLAAGLPGHTVVVSARDGARPLLAASGELLLAVGARGTLVLEGLVVSGGRLRLPDDGSDEPRHLVLRDCTLVPGRTLRADGSAASPGAVSLVVEHPFADVTLERCITGALQVVADTTLALSDCIVDAGGPTAVAFDGDGAGGPGAALTASDCTLIGKLHTRLAQRVQNSLLFAALGPAPLEAWPAPVRVERRQAGCMRFCYVPTGSITPRRFRCVPDSAHPDALPQFTSLRYGDAGYAQLRPATDLSIREGAEDGSEMGVLRPLSQPQREANLRIRLDEYLRFGLHAGVFHAT
jgi:hypothetical protein